MKTPAPQPPPDDSSAVVDLESALVARAIQGEQSALRALYGRHAARITRLVARILGGSDADLDDVVSLTFQRAFEGLDRFRGESSFGRWLATIAVNEARGHLRWRRVRGWFGAGARPIEEVDLPAEAGQHTALAARRALRLVAGLTSDLRIAYVLRHVEGLELKEAAEVAGMSLATFKRRLARAQQLVRARAQSDAILSAWVQGPAQE